MNVSRPTAYKWWNRYRTEGPAGLMDRSSRPLSCPHQTPRRVERRILSLRKRDKLGPARLAGITGVPSSTVHRVLVRHGVNRLSWMDRPTAEPVPRIVTTRCGELVHIDVKKLVRIPDGGRTPHVGTGGPHRLRRPKGLGYTHIHTAIDAYSRLAYSEFAGTENTENCVAFLDRAIAWFALRGIRIERFNRTLSEEWAYTRLYPNETARADALAPWLHKYNHHRHHTAVGGPPASRVNNLSVHYKCYAPTTTLTKEEIYSFVATGQRFSCRND